MFNAFNHHAVLTSCPPMLRGLQVLAKRQVNTDAHLKVFSNPGAAKFLTAAVASRNFPDVHGLPEVIVAGRANVGKSTLFNAVIGRKDLLHTSKKPGRTKSLNFYRVGSEPGRLVLVDSPGYGMRGRPEWGKVWNDYIDTRDELRRIYILINASHGVTEYDEAMLVDLNTRLSANAERVVSVQPILTKMDKLTAAVRVEHIKAMLAKIYELAPICMPVIMTSSVKAPIIGIQELRHSIVEACERRRK